MATDSENKESEVIQNDSQALSPKVSTIERQKDLIVKALTKAKANDGVFLNATGKTAPSLYPSGKTMTPFNSVILAIHSDEGEYKTNSYTTFREARKRSESVQSKQKGVPYNWTSWNEYVHKEYPESVIDKNTYKTLTEDQQKQYKPIPKKETMTLFNIDQTTMPFAHKEVHQAEVSKNGNAEDRTHKNNEDRKLRVEVNNLILKVRDNMTAIRKDGSGLSFYDAKKDVIHMPAQNAYKSYSDYVGDLTRQMVTATGHQLRLGRISMDMQSGKNLTDTMKAREMLVTELAAGAKSLQYGMPARLSPHTLENVDKLISYLEEKPERLESLERDVDQAIAMINKAERGEKVELRPTSREIAEWQKDIPKEGVPEEFDAVHLMKDDDKLWTLYVKPVNEKPIAVHPDPEEVTMFFNLIRNNATENTVDFRQKLGQKYYAEVRDNPRLNVDLFGSKATAEQLSHIGNVNIFKTKATEDKESRILCVATIDDKKQQVRELSNDQWQRIWLAPDMKDFKIKLAGTLYHDVLSQKQDESKTQAKTETPIKTQNVEDKPKEQEAKQEQKAEQELKQEQKTKLSPILKQYLDLKAKHPDALVLFRAGDFYETYMEDAKKASNILGITLTKSSKLKDPEGKPLAMAGFPFHALDSYLPKLVRNGCRVAICDQIESPRQNVSQDKTEKQEPEESQEKEEKQSHGFHR